jgi:hypothetical protein
VTRYTPSDSAAGGKTLTLTSPVKALDEGQGLFSYSVLVPLATAIEGETIPENAILVSDMPAKYIRQLQVEGSNLVKVDTVYLSAQDRGTFRQWSAVW